MLLRRIGYFICALYCINLGIIVLGTKMMHNRDVLVDFRDMGYFYIIPGTLVIGFGFAFLYLALRKKPKDYRLAEQVMKCKKCRDVFSYKDTNDGKCPVCDIDLIEIETFYEEKREKIEENFLNYKEIQQEQEIEKIYAKTMLKRAIKKLMIRYFIVLCILLIVFSILVIVYPYSDTKLYIIIIGVAFYSYFLFKAYVRHEIKVLLWQTFIVVGLIGFAKLCFQIFYIDKSFVKVNVEKNIKQKYNINFSHNPSVFQTKEQKDKYLYGSIKEKIIILKNMGLSETEVYKKLQNDTEFRQLIKDGVNKFKNIYYQNENIKYP